MAKIVLSYEQGYGTHYVRISRETPPFMHPSHRYLKYSHTAAIALARQCTFLRK